MGSSEQAVLRRQENLEKKMELGFIGAEVVKVRGQSVGQAIRDLERRPGVEYAEPNFRVYLTGFADESNFPKLWGLHNTGQMIEGSLVSGGCKIARARRSQVSASHSWFAACARDPAAPLAGETAPKPCWPPARCGARPSR